MLLVRVTGLNIFYKYGRMALSIAVIEYSPYQVIVLLLSAYTYIFFNIHVVSHSSNFKGIGGVMVGVCAYRMRVHW